MRIVYLLLHDFRFASISFEEFAYRRFHFSKEYARRMAGLGHDVKLYVLSTDFSEKRVIDIDGYELKAFRVDAKFPPLQRFGNSHSLEALREIARDSPDLVHLHNYYLWNFPYVATFVRRRGIPLVAQYHGSDPIRTLKGLAYSLPLRLCSSLLVPLRSEQEFLRRLGLPQRRIALFPSTGVDVTEFHRVGIRDSEPLLLYVGRVPERSNYVWEKSPEYLLPMLRALKDSGSPARIAVAGDGPGLSRLMESAKILGVREQVDFLGHRSHGAVSELLSRAWLTLVPIQLEEIGPYWGGTVQESLACGTPIVGFNNEGPGPTRYGLLVPTDSARAATMLVSALRDPSLFSRVEAEGPKVVRETCTWDVITGRLEELYRGLSN